MIVVDLDGGGSKRIFDVLSQPTGSKKIAKEKQPLMGEKQCSDP